MRLRRRDPVSPTPTTRSFATWEETAGSGAVVVCHPDWRGIRTAAYTFREPVVETADAAAATDDIVEGMLNTVIPTVVVHGFPPGSEVLLRAAKDAGIGTRVVLHSSMAQHGAEAGEAAVADTVLGLTRRGVVDRVGFVKHGLAEVFAAMGYRADYVPNRAPDIGAPTAGPMEPGLVHVGVFAEPFWRKNVVTQLGAAALMPNTRAHVMRLPEVGYVASLDAVEHGELPWEAFLDLQASMDLNLYVTLSECHPLTPVESYLSGIPCLISPTSVLFADDPDLHAITSVPNADDPAAIASAAAALLADAAGAVARARAWITRWDGIAADRWRAFLSG